MSKQPLILEIIAKCSTSKARVCKLSLSSQVVDTPVFMPVGTQGAMKAVTVKQLEDLDCQIILGNTYHLGHRPGPEILQKNNGLHQFMRWKRALLTDSGGFQMVSLAKLSSVEEDGVHFQSPHDSSLMLLTPERSMQIQGAIGADICMQLDDVVHSSTTGERLEEAMHRSIRWLDRCIAAQPNTARQNLFAIVQGGLDADLRRQCAIAMAQRDVPGFAIGGLSGGEAKDDFWRMVTLSTDLLPTTKPRYLMGVGLPMDLVVSTALGCDMFDCVLPTRTARFGNVFVPSGSLNLKSARFADDPTVIQSDCRCLACTGGYSRAYLHSALIGQAETAILSLLTLHNICYQLTLMRSMRQAISDDTFTHFVRQFMKDQFFEVKAYPDWVVQSLESVNITLTDISGEL